MKKPIFKIFSFILPVILFGLYYFYIVPPRIGKFTEILSQSNYYYVFDFEEYRGKLYAFLSSNTKLEVTQKKGDSLIMVLDNKSKKFINFSVLNLPSKNTFIRNAYNDGNKRLFIVTSDRDISGEIYLTEDMKNFREVFHSEKFGIRSIIKFNNSYYAGLDGNNREVLISKNGIDWTKKLNSSILSQVNEMVIFQDKLLLIDNKSVATINKKKIKPLFDPREALMQMYAVLLNKKVIYVGTGWENPVRGINKSKIYFSYDGVNFTKLTDIPQSPLLYFLIPASNLENDLLWGGYQSAGIYRYLPKINKSKPVYKLPPDYSPYSMKLYQGEYYIGTYPTKIIRYTPSK